MRSASINESCRIAWMWISRKSLLRNRADAVVAHHIGITRLSHCQDFAALLGRQELTFLVEELQCVPLGRVVGGRENDSAPSSLMEYGHLYCRRCRESGVDYVAAGALQCAYDNPGTQLTRHPGVTADNDRGSAVKSMPAPGAVGGCETNERRRIESVPKNSPNPGNRCNERHIWSLRALRERYVRAFGVAHKLTRSAVIPAPRRQKIDSFFKRLCWF